MLDARQVIVIDVRRDVGQKLSFTVSLMQNTRQNPGPKAFGRLVLEDYLF